MEDKYRLSPRRLANHKRAGLSNLLLSAPTAQIKCGSSPSGWDKKALP